MTTTSYGFTEIVDFTRASTATYTNSSGLIATTPASKNLLTYTQELDNTWSKQNVTITPNTTIAPNNTTTADTIVATASTALHLVSQGPNVVSGTTYTFSIYVKAGTHSFVQLALNFATFGAVYANFNLTTGTVGNSSGASPTITNITDGWYRCTVTAAATASGNGAPGIALVSSNTAARLESWTTTGTETIIAWGGQLEASSSVTSYTRNYGSVYPPRFDYDPITLQPKGFLVEEQRTNICLQSGDMTLSPWSFVGGNRVRDVVAPDGTISATRYYGPSTSPPTQPGIIATSTTMTYSIYTKWISGNTSRSFLLRNTTTLTNFVTGSFDYSTGVIVGAGWAATAVGNDWYRLTYTQSTGIAVGDSLQIYVGAAGAVTTFNGEWAVWGAQVEGGAFATSYIPTGASTVTRAADVATISGTNFSSWYNINEGTLIITTDSFTNIATSPVPRACALTDGSTSNYVDTYIYNGKWGGGSKLGGVYQFDLNVNGSYTPNITVKVGVAFKDNDFAVSVNGSVPLTDTSGTVPAVNSLSIGSIANMAYINGHIKYIKYYPYRLTNAQLQSLTI